MTSPASMPTITDLAAQAERELFGNILPFWSGPARDRNRGGWMGWLSNDLRPRRTRPRGLVLYTRILWTFSAAYRVRPEPALWQLAAEALDWVLTRFWDPRHGGAFWSLDNRGRVQDDSKQAYGQAFVIYALAEYHLAFGSAPALDRARELFGLLERHTHDPAAGGYFDARARDWSAGGVASRVGGAEFRALKSLNTNLHLLEALTALHRAGPDPLVATRIRELVRLTMERMLDPRTHHLHHFFDAGWQPLSRRYSFGHDIEASWLLVEAAQCLGDPALQAEVRPAALGLARVTLAEGLDPAGGVWYEGREGWVTDPGKEWWTQAEAVVGFVNAWQLGGGAEYLEAAHRTWQFLAAHLVDRVHGDWFWRVGPDGSPDPGKPKVSEWKCPYHSGRACLELMRRLGPGRQPGALRA